MKNSRLLIIGWILTFSFSYENVSEGLDESKLERFLNIAEEVRLNSGVPGVGLAIVHDGEIVHAGGLGFRNIAESKPVDQDTLFCIGSNTKAFTAFLAVRLRSRELVDWKKPLNTYVPELKLSEKYVQNNVTLEDALAHRVGLGRHDNIWKYKSLTRQQLLPLLDDLSFSSVFRSGFDYNNLMYTVAGIALERVTAQSWETLVEKEIFQPLGMTESLTSCDRFKQVENRATGYHLDGSRPTLTVDMTSIASAGSIYSSSGNMAIWIQMLVNEGHHHGARFLSRQEYDFWLRPSAHISIRNENELWYYNAGLGGFQKNGKRSLGANGAIDGQNSRCLLLLDEGLGIFVMTNQVSEYKELISEYGQQIFLDGDVVRDVEKEAKIARRYSFERFLTSLLEKNLVAATKEFEEMNFKPTESLMNQLGERLLEQNDNSKAISIFRLNARAYPRSSQAQLSLAKANVQIDNTVEALKCLRKCLQLDPGNEVAAKWIQTLDADQ